MPTSPEPIIVEPVAPTPPELSLRLPRALTAAALALALLFVALWIIRHSTHTHHGMLLFNIQLVTGLVLLVLLFPLAWRFIHAHLLWSLRSKLILTYLLIGLAPAVLFLTLAAISAYIAVGQFSIHLADSRMHQELDQLGADNLARVRNLSRMLEIRDELRRDHITPPQPPRQFQRPPNSNPQAPRPQAPRPQPSSSTQQSTSAAALITTAQITAETPPETLPDPLRARLHRHPAVYLNGAPFDLIPGLPPPQQQPSQPQPHPAIPKGLPAWASDLGNKQFRGLVLDGNALYLVAIDQRRTPQGVLTAIESLPVDSALIDVIAQGLGRVRLADLIAPSRLIPISPARPNGPRHATILGGVEPQPVNSADFTVSFPSTLNATDWTAGPEYPDSISIDVRSRPSLLYRQLFGSSLGGVITRLIRNGLIILTLLFALIIALALWMALRLSSAITASVSGLYDATQRVDRGELAHRITVPTQRDQLTELSHSFNSMTGSLERLVVEQKEKERLQSELSIAQEVQANLFPHLAHSLPTLELHGICRPARSVSGDYYDFLVFHQKDQDAHQQDTDSQPSGELKESGVAIVLGDISGKGISAALLMATLHSAVRAYRFASEDLVYSSTGGVSSVAGVLTTSDTAPSDSGKLFESPGRILALLNRHLYRSTQPEKYATLFLAHYDAAGSTLTYANAGHLPPFVLSLDGTLRRLDRGGTVVGLIDNVAYDEGRIPLAPGDLLVAFSDGVTEPENDFGDFGEQRLIDLITRLRDQPLAVISAEVMRTLDTWIGPSEQPDDITLVLARQL